MISSISSGGYSSGLFGVQGAGGVQPPKPDDEQMGPPDFTELDTDGSGGVDLEELTEALSGHAGADAESIFNAVDADEDGVISEEENDAFLESMEESMGMAGGPQGAGGPPPGPHPGPPPGESSEDEEDDLLSLFGVEEDEEASETTAASETAETTAADMLEELLAAIDSNEDGEISSDEQKTFLDALKEAEEERSSAQQAQLGYGATAHMGAGIADPWPQMSAAGWA